MLPTALLALAALALPASPVRAAGADDWRTKSIYQILTDRFALPPGVTSDCDPRDQRYCGGTYTGIIDKLDYIQGMGFSAIWISPTVKGYQGRTAYGEGYHGYWPVNIFEPNEHFGTNDELKKLSDALHARNMYLMVDIVVNHVAVNALPPNTDYSGDEFTSNLDYHPYCEIEYSNTTSEELCWMGDDKLPLADVNTENPEVISTFNSWIADFVDTYKVDGLRIDAAKHIRKDFWGPFCKSAGVFCIGEVFNGDTASTSEYQSSDSLDSVLNYPLHFQTVQGFRNPGGNTSALVDMIGDVQRDFADPSVLGSFLECHDVARWMNHTVDPINYNNALTFQFLTDGIPITYYGGEQDLTGIADPLNREPLWPTNYANTTRYQLVARLNKLRTFLINNHPEFLSSPTQVLTHTDQDVALQKGPLLLVLSNRGSPPADANIAVLDTIYGSGSSLTDALTCTRYPVGSGNSVLVNWKNGGHPQVLLETELYHGSGVCDQTATEAHFTGGNSASSLSYTSSLLFVGALLSAALAL